MTNKNVVRQKLCSFNLYAISYVVTWNLKIIKYSPSTMKTHLTSFDVSVALLFLPEKCQKSMKYDIKNI